MNKQIFLTFSDHSRQFKNCRYIYPVVSRRAEGISLGINLNTNNACNWRCVYCQVEGLIRGMPDPINLHQLEYELDGMLEWIMHGDFIKTHAKPPLQRLNDICLSGNGESTLSKDFVAVSHIIVKLRKKYGLGTDVKTILISNGSEFHSSEIQDGLKIIAANNGEVWFKIDRATKAGINAVNQVNIPLEGVIRRLEIAADLCPTWIQSCWFKTGGVNPDDAEVEEFIALIRQVKDLIKGVLLYSTARNPALPEGQAISQVNIEFLASMAQKLTKLGIPVKYYQ